MQADLSLHLEHMTEGTFFHVLLYVLIGRTQLITAVLYCTEPYIIFLCFQILLQDYHWWWRSFIVSGGSAVYVFAYSVFYFVTKVCHFTTI